jgi:cell division septum initiation protein DivIVA
MSDKLAPVPITNGAVRSLLEDPEFRVVRRGYHPEDVAGFLDGLGTRVVKLIGRLRGAEKENRELRGAVDAYRTRAEQAESSRALFARALTMAEETANAAVADARQRAEEIDAEAQRDARRMVDETRLRVERMMDAARVHVQRVYADERAAIAQAQAHVRSESDQLETLRLAVAAETMGLEEVRNELIRRIRGVASELVDVAESPEHLGTPVTRHMPDRLLDQPPVNVDPAIAGADDPVAIAPPPIAARMSAEHQDRGPIVAPEAAEDGAIDLAGTDGPEPEAGAEATDDEAAGDEATADATVPAPGGDAFDRFMSSEIEEEPSRTWILT